MSVLRAIRHTSVADDRIGRCADPIVRVRLPALGHRYRRFRRALLVLIPLTLAMGCQGDDIGRALAELKAPDMEVRRKAVQALCARKSSDPRIIGGLCAALSDPDQEVRRWACRGLGENGSPAVQTTLETTLSDPEIPVRRAAAFALQRLAPDSTAYRVEILEAMKSGEGGVIVALADWEPKPVWTIPTLISLLKDRRPGIRRLSAETLGHFGPAASSAITALKNATNDQDDRVRDAARGALEHIHLR